LLLSAYNDPELETDLKPCFASHRICGTEAAFNLTGETKPSGFTVSTELIVMGKAQLNPLS